MGEFSAILSTLSKTMSSGHSCVVFLTLLGSALAMGAKGGLQRRIINTRGDFQLLMRSGKQDSDCCPYIHEMCRSPCKGRLCLSQCVLTCGPKGEGEGEGKGNHKCKPITCEQANPNLCVANPYYVIPFPSFALGTPLTQDQEIPPSPFLNSLGKGYKKKKNKKKNKKKTNANSPFSSDNESSPSNDQKSQSEQGIGGDSSVWGPSNNDNSPFNSDNGKSPFSSDNEKSPSNDQSESQPSIGGDSSVWGPSNNDNSPFNANNDNSPFGSDNEKSPSNDQSESQPGIGGDSSVWGAPPSNDNSPFNSENENGPTSSNNDDSPSDNESGLGSNNDNSPFSSDNQASPFGPLDDDNNPSNSSDEEDKFDSEEKTIKCDKDFTRVGDKCMAMFDKPTSWLMGLTACMILDGTIATIHNRKEQDAVLSLTGGKKSWIGLKDFQDEGTFTWMNQDPVGFTNWAEGEPSGEEEEDCVSMGEDGKWSDDHCKDKLPYVCQKDLPN